MELARLFDELCAAARRAGVDVRLEPFAAAVPDAKAPRGGLCTLRGRRTIVVDEAAPLPDRVAALAGALAHVDLEAIFVPPIVRATIGAYRRDPRGAGARTTPMPLARAKKRPGDDD